MSDFICEGTKYELVGTNKDTLSLPIDLEGLPEEVEVQGRTLYLPMPFHVSLVYIGKIIEKYKVSTPDFLEKVVDDFCNFTATHEIKLISYKNDEYKFVSRDETKQTVVVMCEVSNINKFYDVMNEKYGLNLKYPATHVTLYNTLKGQPGTWLMDEDDIKDFTTPIDNPIGYPL